MKYSPNVSASRRKSRRDYFTADSASRRVMMSSGLSKELAKKHGVRSVPIKRGDEVKVVRGEFKSRSGKVTQVYRKKFVLFVDGLTRFKGNADGGIPRPVPIHSSNVQITELLMDSSRKALLARKKEGRKAVKGEKDLSMVD